jgi:hypothetical protein
MASLGFVPMRLYMWFLALKMKIEYPSFNATYCDYYSGSEEQMTLKGIYDQGDEFIHKYIVRRGK